jgi:hypothetical protein
VKKDCKLHFIRERDKKMEFREIEKKINGKKDIASKLANVRERERGRLLRGEKAINENCSFHKKK